MQFKCSGNLEEAWINQVIEKGNTEMIINDLIEKSIAVLDFYYDARISTSYKEAIRETKIKFDLENSIKEAKKFINNL